MDQIIGELQQFTPLVLSKIFFCLLIIDIITGFVKAHVTQTFTSREATNGLLRQCVRFVVFLALVYGQQLLNESALIHSVLVTIQVGFITAYCRSIRENFQEIEGDFWP
ncbi:MAG: phage holin family protein [Culicoidibacterales bacterium]